MESLACLDGTSEISNLKTLEVSKLCTAEGYWQVKADSIMVHAWNSCTELYLV